MNEISRFEWKTVKCQEGTWKTFGGELDETCSNDEAVYLVIDIFTKSFYLQGRSKALSKGAPVPGSMMFFLRRKSVTSAKEVSQRQILFTEMAN